MHFIIVENRINKAINASINSAREASVQLTVLDSTEGGAAFEELKAAYIHRSTNSKEFELICFRRYFILHHYLEDNTDIEEFVLLDSDVLLFRGIEEHIRSICKGQKFCGSWANNVDFEECQVSPHVSYWTRAAIFEFTDFLISAYNDAIVNLEMEKIESRFKEAGRLGGISDMTLLYLWCTKEEQTCAINQPYAGAFIDHNISMSRNGFQPEFQRAFGTKSLKYAGDDIFAKHKNGELKVLALHFQGRAKVLMPYVLKRAMTQSRAISLLLFLARKLKSVSYRIAKSTKNGTSTA